LPFFDPRARPHPCATLLQRIQLTGNWQRVTRHDVLADGPDRLFLVRAHDAPLLAVPPPIPVPWPADPCRYGGALPTQTRIGVDVLVPRNSSASPMRISVPSGR
jgi:hypothetical protein